MPIPRKMKNEYRTVASSVGEFRYKVRPGMETVSYKAGGAANSIEWFRIGCGVLPGHTDEDVSVDVASNGKVREAIFRAGAWLDVLTGEVINSVAAWRNRDGWPIP